MNMQVKDIETTGETIGTTARGEITAAQPAETLLEYQSHDGKTQIHAYLWPEAVNPRGIIQIAHGAAEYSERYREFATFLNSEGYIVCANDHIGHGKSVSDPAQLGHMPLKGGKDILVRDVHRLRELVSDHYNKDLPYIVLGHSMGSFIFRCYITQYAKGLAAVVLSGTSQPPLVLSVFGNLVTQLRALMRGATYRSSFVDNLGMGAFAKTIPGAQTKFDWISTDPTVVDAYMADDICGRMFTVGGYATLSELTTAMVDEQSAKQIPHDLPLLFISGGDDPVGDKGEGVKQAAEQYRRAGLDSITVRIYQGLRHEVLNEPVRAEVYRDITDWLEQTIS